MRYLVVAVLVFGLNLLPAFGPPTWAALVLFKLNWHLNPVALVVIGALSAGAGRLCLAYGTRYVKKYLSPKRVENMRAAGDYLRRHKGRSVLGLVVFAISPLPSAQLFEAAALIDAPLIPLTGSFVVGRLVTYSLYIGGATAAEKTFGGAFRKALTSPYAIALEFAMLVGIVLLARVDWTKRLGQNVRR